MIWLILIFTLIFPPVLNAQDISPTATPTPTETPVSTNTPTPTLTPTPTIVTNPSGGIYINEFMPAPDDNQEWVELYNSYDYPVKIENWKFDDIADGGGSPKELGTLTLAAKELKIIDLGSSYLNNGEDWVRLLNQSGQLMDLYHYQSVSTTQSWSKNGSTWCLTSPTKGSTNNSCPSPTATITPTPTNTPVPTSTTVPSPTSTPKPTSTPFPSLPPEPSLTPINDPLPQDQSLDTLAAGSNPSPTGGDTLGISDILKPSPTPGEKKPFSFPTQILPGLFIGLGGLLLVTPLVISKIKKHES